MYSLRLIFSSAITFIALTACAPVDLDPIMGRTDGTAIPAPAPKLDCDLIFPPASVNQ